ncbi:glycosyltransferase [Lacinutrix sp. WUR7]|uniref:glycosyltransferase n=1 Tax=Lacinutrix sp. WUR7 TaxID=2653681 RepID=UPI00193C89F9|nr:glycosyltransferase [Lacinutrix sp. WUR7]QRM87785.1 glycosyltransferase [Lacinutrix sp. WUR7]
MKSKKIKILFTISNFDTAGSGKVVYDLVQGLDKTKFEVEIACGSKDGAFFKVVESLGLPIHVFETKTPYKPYSSLLFRIWKISKFYKKQQYDIVHSWQWSGDWTEAMAAKLVGVKWMYTKKAMGFNGKHWRIKSYLADFIVTINDEMRAYFPNKKQEALIPLGIDTDYYSPNLFADAQKDTTDKFHVITVANLVPVKGIQILIQAVSDLNNPAIQLSVLGDYDNPYGHTMVALSEQLGMQEQIRFLGKQLDVRPYIAEADLYVIPTLDEGRKEGMPMALVEAMSMAVPVIGSDITGINFVLKDFKEFLFPAGDVQALTLKIEEMRAKDLRTRKEIGQDLRAYCEAHFTMHAFITAHESLYTTLLYGE